MQRFGGFKETATFALAIENKAIALAEVAQLVEHNLAKVRVAGSSPVFRSLSLIECPGGGIGRRARFRCEWFCDRAGSSPVLGTPLFNAQMVKLVDTLL